MNALHLLRRRLSAATAAASASVSLLLVLREQTESEGSSEPSSKRRTHSSLHVQAALQTPLASLPPSIWATSAFRDDSYPRFSKYHRSLLKKYLTPDQWKTLKDRTTANGVTLEDIIQGGMALPHGADPPRGVGIFAGDAESYRVFAPLFDSIISEYHRLGGGGLSRFRRHDTYLNPDAILSKNPDPTGNYILSTRLRVGRSIEGFAFPPCISRSDRRKVEELVKSAVVQGLMQQKCGGGGRYLSLWDMTNEENDDLIQRHILFDNPNEWAIAAGLGRDWPDARGLYVNVEDLQQTPDVMVWCNEEDHIRIISMRKGGNIKAIFTNLSKAIDDIEKSLLTSGHSFCRDHRLGYLNTCPSNIGTALRASVHVKLIHLGKLQGFKDMVERMRLDARGAHGESDKRYTGIFDISNRERLGQSEVQLINIMIEGVAQLIAFEQKLERGERVDCTKLP